MMLGHASLQRLLQQGAFGTHASPGVLRQDGWVCLSLEQPS
jgi:hypothetical protein